MKRSCISVVHRLRTLVLWGEWTFIVAGGETVGYNCLGIVGTETNWWTMCSSCHVSEFRGEETCVDSACIKKETYQL